ncbi:MAG: cache domain-containing protein, partial [Pseudobdellovibrionaceae bacterium]
VAVPVLRPNKSVLGILGASIDLNKLNQQIKKEMDLDERYIFYAIDSTTQIALHREANMVFTRPADFGEELKKVFDEVIQHQQGFAQYQFKNTQRMVLYRKSPITNWWYAFGVVQPEK